jgi:hypothetical protein
MSLSDHGSRARMAAIIQQNDNTALFSSKPGVKFREEGRLRGSKIKASPPVKRET